MPPGTPLNSIIYPYFVRVDNFTSTDLAIPPALHLLTHTHTDHLNGLSAPSFSARIICSPDSKEMLLRHEVYSERAMKDLDIRAEKVRTFAHLKVNPRMSQDGTIYYDGSRDLLHTIPLNTPTSIELKDGESITLTLFDANHCPGAVMFLVEGDRGAVLHTGDFRAEPWFLESLKKNPMIQKYLHASPSRPPSMCLGTTNNSSVVQTLDAIYLDTATLFSTIAVPTKDVATTGLVSLMCLFPSSTLFFINAWTWGYEDILKAVSRAFHSKIHVDRYKYSVYTHIKGDPFLASVITQDAACTRFHACERFSRCEHVSVDGLGNSASTEVTSANRSLNKHGEHVVYVNPVTMGIVGWDLYLQETRDKLMHGEVINHLLVPLSRHSPLPELREFVSLFRPKRLIPNTLDPTYKGLDWACMHEMFADCLAVNDPRQGGDISPPECGSVDPCQIVQDLSDSGTDEDVALKNLEGDGARELAETWAVDGKASKKLGVMRQFLSGRERAVVEQVLAAKEQPVVSVSQAIDEELSQNGSPKSPKGPQYDCDTRQKSAFQGRATLAETAQAMARMHTVPPVFLKRDTDEDTEDEEAEIERARTAHQLFAEQAGIPLDADPSGIFSRNLSPPGHSSLHSPAKLSSLPERMPLTPISIHESSPSPLFCPSSNMTRARQGTTTGTPRTPQSKQIPHSPPSDTKRATFSVINLAYRSRQKRDVFGTTSPPLLDMHNLLARLSKNSDKHTQDVLPLPKRRKLEDLPEKLSKSGRSAILSGSPPQSDASRLARYTSLGAQSSIDGCHVHFVSVKESDMRPASRSRVTEQDLHKGQRHARRTGSLKIAEKLSLARPDLVTEKYATRMERRQSRLMRKKERKDQHNALGQVSSVVTGNHEASTKIHNDRPLADVSGCLPSQDGECGSQGPMDEDRSRQLTEHFKEQLAMGRRAGLVIPRLSCLESQEQ